MSRFNTLQSDINQVAMHQEESSSKAMLPGEKEQPTQKTTRHSKEKKKKSNLSFFINESEAEVIIIK